MTIELQVAWNNSSSNIFLNSGLDSLLAVTQSRGVVTEDKGQRRIGARVFQLADDGNATVTFDLKVPSLGGGVTGLKVIQSFACSGGKLTPSTYDTEAVTGIAGTHPLATFHDANQASTHAIASTSGSKFNAIRRPKPTMTVNTEFVDVTQPWLEQAAPAGSEDRRGWNVANRFNTQFFALACLGGFPPLWFASVPKACGASDHVSALVFYRPTGYQYVAQGDDQKSMFSIVDGLHQGEGFWRLWRFLLTPICTRPSDSPPPAPGTLIAPAFGGSVLMMDHSTSTSVAADHWNGTFNVPASFERMLDDYGRPLVVFYPAPNGAMYGSDAVTRHATSSSLSDMAQTAAACLHARGAVQGGPSGTPFGGLQRFGLAAFSGGGDSVWAALAASLSATRGSPRVRELYLFDANGWPPSAASKAHVMAAARAAGVDFCLRVVPTDAVKADLSTFRGGMKASVHPDLTQDPDFSDLENSSPGLSSWYAHFAARTRNANRKVWFSHQMPDDRLTWDRGARHQFAIFGGEDSSRGWTFLRVFLELSGF